MRHCVYASGSWDRQVAVPWAPGPVRGSQRALLSKACSPICHPLLSEDMGHHPTSPLRLLTRVLRRQRKTADTARFVSSCLETSCQPGGQRKDDSSPRLALAPQGLYWLLRQEAEVRPLQPKR